MNSNSGAKDGRYFWLAEARAAKLQKTGYYKGGKVPFGYNVSSDGKLVRNVQQQDAIERMRVLRASGTSLRAIAREMAEKGINVTHVTVQRWTMMEKKG